MPNGLDAKVNGSVAPRKPASAALGRPMAAARPRRRRRRRRCRLTGSRSRTCRSSRSSTSSSCAIRPASIRRGARYFQAAERQQRRNGAGARALVPPAAFPRSIFAAPARPRVGRRRHRQPHLGPPALRTRAAPGRGLSRARPPDRQPRPAGAGAAQAAADRARGLRARRRGSRPGVQQRERGRPGPTTLRELVGLLRETYSRTIGVELAHLHDVELRSWLQSRMESDAQPAGADARGSAARCSTR